MAPGWLSVINATADVFQASSNVSVDALALNPAAPAVLSALGGSSLNVTGGTNGTVPSLQASVDTPTFEYGNIPTG